MKATLYEALGIPQAASDEEVRASLRRLIRKYYAKTRDGQGNVEEALRFINHASRILSDPDRRTRYDNELALSAGTTEQRIAHVVTNAVAESGEQTDVGTEAVDRAAAADVLDDEALEAALTADDERQEPNLHHPGLTERVSTLGRSPVVTLALCALFGAFIAAAIVFVTPADAVLVAKQVLVWLTLGLLGLTAVYGAVHGIAWASRRRAPAAPALLPQTDLAILNWRREKSVFLGTNQPQEDASWIFQLRMAELERAKSGRTSEPRPWQRLGARLFDYAIWGLVLALLLSELRGAGAVPEQIAYWLGHPLVAPILITGSWVPIEALLIASLTTTPGKWLFGVYLQFSISDAYARRDSRTQFARALKRAFRVWWEGVGCGFPLLAPFLVAVAYEKVMVRQETDWDFAHDCLVTHGPPGVLNLVTGVCGLAAMLWLYGVAWHQPMADSITWARATITDAIPSSAMLRNFSGSSAIGGLAPSTPVRTITPASKASAAPTPPRAGEPIDSDLSAKFAERRSRIAVLAVEGPRMLRAGNWRRAGELCRTWTELDLGNPEGWRCLGQAMQAQGYHQEAIAAFRKAKQYDPGDRTLDAAIDRSQRGIVADFINRYRQ
ncbi:MAG: DnaJ domain-containing protein [Betaproteobacteria bacterium]|nr:DnaJ domain-containing protein [Betaproteobacteria bacterium]